MTARLAAVAVIAAAKTAGVLLVAAPVAYVLTRRPRRFPA